MVWSHRDGHWVKPRGLTQTTRASRPKRSVATAVANVGLSLKSRLVARQLASVLNPVSIEAGSGQLQVIVTWISDDELQVWCKKSVFGTAPLNRPLAEQNKALETAIKDIS